MMKLPCNVFRKQYELSQDGRGLAIAMTIKMIPGLDTWQLSWNFIDYAMGMSVSPGLHFWGYKLL